MAKKAPHKSQTRKPVRRSKPKPKPRGKREMPEKRKTPEPKWQPDPADSAPPWLQAMRAISGLTEYSNGSNPKIEAMAAYIGNKFPEQASYAALYTDDSIAWCGVTAAFCMAVSDISGPFGPTDTDKWMWALSWSDSPDYKHLPAPVLGCLVAMERSGGGHITMFESWDGGNILCRGGNQSDAVNVASYDPDTVVAYVWPQSVPAPPTPPADRGEVEEGDDGPEVVAIQTTLGVHPADGDFGSITDSAVEGYQAACSISADGVVGPTTWGKLDELDARVAKGSDGLDDELIDAIMDVAENSAIADYNWAGDRGVAPIGYTMGIALCFALAMQRLDAGDAAAFEMAQANTGDEDTDVFAWYAKEFRDAGMDNGDDVEAVVRLRHLFALMLGLGMRESSGRYSEGVDQSASNHEADTAEAGMFQTSWNIRSCSGNIPPLLTQCWDNPCGFREQFQKGVTLKNGELRNYGSGDGAKYQFLSKYAPSFHALVTALGLRNLRQHWGPINRREVELREDANTMLLAVQALVEGEVEPPGPEPEPGENRVDIVATHPEEVEVTVTGDVDVTVNGEPWEPQ